MAQTTVLTSATAAGNSSDIVVSTTPVTVALYTDETNGLFTHVKVKIEQKVPGGAYQSFHDEYNHKTERAPVFLYMDKRSYTIKTPGTFRAVKDATATKIGVFTEA